MVVPKELFNDRPNDYKRYVALSPTYRNSSINNSHFASPNNEQSNNSHFASPNNEYIDAYNEENEGVYDQMYDNVSPSTIRTIDGK